MWNKEKTETFLRNYDDCTLCPQQPFKVLYSETPSYLNFEILKTVLLTFFLGKLSGFQFYINDKPFPSF